MHALTHAHAGTIASPSQPLHAPTHIFPPALHAASAGLYRLHTCTPTHPHQQYTRTHALHPPPPLSQHVLASTDYAKQQHVVYLANDVLFKALAQRAEGAGPSGDAVAQAFQPRLGRMLARAYETGGKTEQVWGGGSVLWLRASRLAKLLGAQPQLLGCSPSGQGAASWLPAPASPGFI